MTKNLKETFVILLYILKLCEATDYQCLNCEDFNRQNLLKCAHQIIECADYVHRVNPDDLDPSTLVRGVEGQLIGLPLVGEKIARRNLNPTNTRQWQGGCSATISSTIPSKSGLISIIIKSIDIGKFLEETKTKEKEILNLNTKLGNQTAAIFLICLFRLCSAQDCLNCEDFNRQNLVKCPLHLKQCGECVPGNIPDELDPNICFALVIEITPPRSIEGEKGQLIELPCEFNSKVECVWEKNGQHVNIDDSHRYLFKNKEVKETTPAEDCSLNIEDFSPIDVGNWQCGSKATSSTISVKSALISVVLKESTTTTVSVAQESQLIEITNNANTIHLYLDGVSVDRRVTSMQKIMNGSALECRTEVAVAELRWEIEGQSIATISNTNSVRIQSEDIEKHFTEREWSFAKVYCVAVYTQHKDINSYVFITNQRDVKPIVEIPEEGGGHRLSSAAIIAIAVLITCALLTLLALLLYFYWKKRVTNEYSPASDSPTIIEDHELGEVELLNQNESA